MLKQKSLPALHALSGISPELCVQLLNEFNFDVVASGAEKSPHTSNPTALKLNWFDHSRKKAILFIPPPDEPIGQWLAKAIYESRKGATVIGLLPVRADKEYFHKYIQNIASEVRYIKDLPTPQRKNSRCSKPIAIVVFKEFKGTTRFTLAQSSGEITQFLN